MLDEISLDSLDILSHIDNDMSGDDVISNLDYISKRMEKMYSLNELYIDELSDITKKFNQYNLHLKLIEESKKYYLRAIDLIYENSIGELEKIVNLALKYIFFDTQYQIKIELDDKRGKSLSFFIVDKDNNEVNILDTGCGVRTVVSFILHVYYLLNKGSLPFIFLDEKLSGVSQEYVTRFFSFIQSLCDTKNVTLVLITHDLRYMNYAKKIYSITNGNVVTLNNQSDL